MERRVAPAGGAGRDHRRKSPPRHPPPPAPDDPPPPCPDCGRPVPPPNLPLHRATACGSHAGRRGPHRSGGEPEGRGGADDAPAPSPTWNPFTESIVWEVGGGGGGGSGGSARPAAAGAPAAVRPDRPSPVEAPVGESGAGEAPSPGPSPPPDGRGRAAGWPRSLPLPAAPDLGAIFRRRIGRASGRSDEAAGAGGEGAGGGGWSCPRCTLANGPGSARCGACGCPRPGSSVAPPPVRDADPPRRERLVGDDDDEDDDGAAAVRDPDASYVARSALLGSALGAVVAGPGGAIYGGYVGAVMSSNVVNARRLARERERLLMERERLEQHVQSMRRARRRYDRATIVNLPGSGDRSSAPAA